MKNSRHIVSVLLLVTLLTIGLSATAQRQTSRVNTRQVSNILLRLAQSSDRFRISIRTAVGQTRAEGRRGNEINSLERDFATAMNQLNTRFKARSASAADVRNVLQKASPINDLISRRRFDAQAQNDWASVRSNLEALASAYAVNWQWNSQTLTPSNTSRSNRLSDRELDQLIRRIETGNDTFRSSLTDAFDQTRYDRTGREGNMNNAVGGFKQAIDQLRNRLDARQLVNAGDVEHLLGLATSVDAYMHNNRLTDRAQNDWSTLRGDLTGLASAYEITPNWGNSPPIQTGSRSNNPLTGTFRLDSSRSDDPRDVAARATRSLSNNQRQDISDRLLARLESPEMLAIERSGSSVTIASSRAPKSTFTADGRQHQEQLPSGRIALLTATLQGDQLVIGSTGSSGSDFTVTFDGIENGRLRVTRQISFEQLAQPVVVNSVYDRTSEVAQWNVYNSSQPVLSSIPSGGEFIVRDGETVVAILNTDLTTSQGKQGDRFTMTVREPSQYAGAVIEGTVASVNRGGRLSGRSGMSLSFDTIRLRTGQTYKFAGALGSVRTVNGDTVNVDNEGSAQGDNQTTQTIQRAGIGTAIGAIIGAIAGGGKGAVIGGVIGAAGGAGSVYVQGKDDMDLPNGTELTIRASAPR